MFYVCVICTVSVKRSPLMQLTLVRRLLWERIISPRIRINKIKNSTLLVCSECNQLLDTMLKFRSTMDAGVRHLLGLYSRITPPIEPHMIVRPKVLHELPSVVEAQSYPLLLPVANEEIVSTEPCVDVEAANLAGDKNVTRAPSTLDDHPGVEQIAAQVPEPKVDYAVLIPLNGDTTTNLLCDEDVVFSSEISDASQNEEAMATPKDTKKETIQTDSASENKKIKVNRQLFEAVKVTLQSPTLTEEFDTKFEPDSECERPDSGPDSESTLSCTSDYEDPDHVPNIIFARAFSRSDKDTSVGLARDKAEDAQIHSHIVTNPPSEWPCTWQHCLMQRLHGDEDEYPKAPAVRTGSVATLRSNWRSDPRRCSTCKICGITFPRVYDLVKHYESKHMAGFECNVCRKEFRNETELKLHKIKHQFKSKAVSEAGPAGLLCAECGVRGAGGARLRRHLATASHAARMLWRFQCDICKRKFPDKRRMADHIQRELAKEAVKCPMCSAKFSSARTMRRHAAEHVLAQYTDSQTRETHDRDTDEDTEARNGRDTAWLTNSQTRETHDRHTEDTEVTNGQDTARKTNGQTRETHDRHAFGETSIPNGREAARANEDTDVTNRQGTARQTHEQTHKTSDGHNDDTDVTNGRDTARQTNSQTRMALTARITSGQTRKTRVRYTNKETGVKNGRNTARKTNSQIRKKHDRHTDDINVTNGQDSARKTSSQTQKTHDRHIENTVVTNVRDLARARFKKTLLNTFKVKQDTRTDTRTDTHVEQEVTSQTDGRRPRKKNSQVKSQANKKSTHTDTYSNRQTARTDIQINQDNGTIDTGAGDNMTHTTNGCVRKRRRKRRAYAPRKRARTAPKAAQENAASKITLFDMLASFII